ncbi:MAG: hypothetical protein RRA60_05555 [Chlorobiota bacterium]|nr:hypothetical protein [Chlorobiota bacterium]
MQGELRRQRIPTTVGLPARDSQALLDCPHLPYLRLATSHGHHELPHYP